MNCFYIGAGSNLGDRLTTLRKAYAVLGSSAGIEKILSSAFYETDPVGGPPDSPKFLNAVWAVETELSPRQCLALLQDIENRFGRTRSEADAPRTLDLDLLTCRDMMLEEDDLVLPHPRLHERFFVLKPFSDLAPQWIHPKFRKSAKQLLETVLESHKQS